MSAALLAFATAAVMIVLLIFTLSLTIAAAQERTLEWMQARAPIAKRWGGRILLLVGTWLLLLGLFAGFFSRVFPV